MRIFFACESVIEIKLLLKLAGMPVDGPASMRKEGKGGERRGSVRESLRRKSIQFLESAAKALLVDEDTNSPARVLPDDPAAAPAVDGQSHEAPKFVLTLALNEVPVSLLLISRPQSWSPSSLQQ